VEPILQPLLAAGFTPVSIGLILAIFYLMRKRFLMAERKVTLLHRWYLMFVPNAQREAVGDSLKDTEV
jgi:hypothetical protein